VTGRDRVEHRIAADGVELLDAEFEHHVFERHIHDTYAIGFTLDGVQRFWCRGATHSSTRGHVIMIAPGEVHDGRSGAAGGYAYRMFYVPEGRLRALSVSSPLVSDPGLASRLHLAWRAASHSPASLAAEELFDAAAALLVDRYGGRRTEPPGRLDRPAMKRVHEHLRCSLDQAVRGADLAAVAGMSRFRVSRQFQRAYGLPPHAFHLHVRLQEARRKLASGESIAAVAASLGFADQSHLHRRFKGVFGISPGAWRRAAQRSKPAGA